MKTLKFISLPFVAIAAILLSFTFLAGGSVKGKVNPADGAFQACVIAGTDSIKTNILGGSFEIKNIKPGSYRLLIVATPPYKNSVKEGIEITEANVTDIGEISLQK